MVKNTLIYIFEPLDGWCFGFGPIIKRLEDSYRDKLDFDVLSAGMIIGHRVGPLSHMASFIKQVYPVVEKYAPVRFGSKFLNETLPLGKAMFSSVEPAKALTIFKQFQKEKAIEFSHEIQKLIYVDGINPVDIAAYLPLFERYGIKREDVLPLFSLRSLEQETVLEFAQVQRWKIENFPSVVMQTEEGKAFPVASGFVNFEELEKKVRPYL